MWDVMYKICWHVVENRDGKKAQGIREATSMVVSSVITNFV